MTLVGLDVGTTGVKGGRDLGRTATCSARRGGVPALDAAARLGRAGSRGLVAARRSARSRALPDGPIGLSGQMHGLVALDERRPRAAAGDPLERPAHRRPSAPRSSERIGLERLIELTGNRALDGLHGAEAAVAARHEPEVVRADPARAAAEGLRPPPADRRARDRCRGRVGDAALRRRAPALVGGGLRGARDPARVAAAGARVDGGRRRRATRRPARSASASPRRAPLSVVLGTSGVVFAALPAYAPEPQARVHVFCHAVPGTWHAMGVMLSAAGSLRVAAGRRRRRVRRARRRGGAVGARRRGPAVRAVPRGRAHAACRSGRARRVHGPLAAARPRRARARGDGGRRVRAARLARAAARASASTRRSAASPAAARGASSGCGSSRRCSDSRSSGPQLEEGAAYGAALLAGVRAGVFADAAEAVARCVRVRDRIEPDPVADAYAGRYERFRPSIRTSTTEGAAMSLEGKTAVITGASRGIGAAVARHAARARRQPRARVARGRRPRARQRRRAAVRRSRPRLRSTALCDATAERFGGIDIVVPNAGVGAYGAVPRPVARAPRRDARRQPQGDGVRDSRSAAAHARPRGRRRHARVRGRPPRPAVRGRLLRLEVRPGRASRARSTTSCASTASAARTSARAASRPTSRSTRAAAAPRTCCPG